MQAAMKSDAQTENEFVRTVYVAISPPIAQIKFFLCLTRRQRRIRAATGSNVGLVRYKHKRNPNVNKN
jgi:hypothetical protein